jgi:hypothetical protein
MAATTTQFHPVKFPGEYLKPIANTSTDVFSITSGHTLTGLFGRSTLALFPLAMFNQHGTTAADCIQIPVDGFASRLGFIMIVDSASSDLWPVMAVRYPYGSSWGPAWMQKQDSGWKLMSSTAVHFASTTQAGAYIIGPLDAAKYGITAATSTNSIDLYQTYFEIQVGMTTAKPQCATSTMQGLIGQGIHWSTFSTTQVATNYGSTAGSILLASFEMP